MSSLNYIYAFMPGTKGEGEGLRNILRKRKFFKKFSSREKLFRPFVLKISDRLVYSFH